MGKQEVIIGNAVDVLREMPSESVDCIVTSPPYWALRDYGSEPVIWDGDPACTHKFGGDGICMRCGAWKGQLGLEPTPFEYIGHLMEVFDEAQRVLKPTGGCFVNIGDSYSGSTLKDIPAKSLCLIPYRFAIAMVEHGWICRNIVSWHKENVMPSSCTDRFTVDFEPMFFFTKEPHYYFNQLKEPVCEVSLKRAEYGWKSKKANVGPGQEGGVDVERMGERFVNPEGRNMQTTWTINTSTSHLEHCAMFPTELVARPIQACCPPDGVVLDPFCGSGTTLQYCFEHDIRAIGIEVNPAYKDIIEKRMRKGQATLGEFPCRDKSGWRTCGTTTRA